MMDLFNYRCFWLIYRCRQWLVAQFTPIGLGVLAVLGISAIAGLGSTESMSHLLFFLALTLLGLAGIGSRFLHYRFKATRTLPRFGTVGEPLQYQVEIQNLTPQAQAGLKFAETLITPFPPFQEFKWIKACFPVGRQWQRPWRQRVARQRWAIARLQDLPTLLPKVKTKVTVEIIPLKRGRLALDTMTVACPDPLGLLYRRQRYTDPQSVCILPQRYELPPLNLPATRRHQMGEQMLASSIGESLEFRSLRDYRPGDPTNKIHWKSWAKVGRPIVREQQDESAIHHALILDTFLPEAESEIFEAALAVALSVLTQTQPEETRLDVIFATHQPRCVTVGRGLRQRAPLLETLATLSPCQDLALESLTPILQARLPRLSGCFCIFISPDETRYAFLRRLAQSGIPIKAIFLCEPNLPQPEGMGYYLTPQCHTHVIPINYLQQELWLI
jgi:hypothetical protein